MNGKVIASKLPNDAVLILPHNFPKRIYEVLEDAGFYIGSEFRDGTGTTALTFPNPDVA